MNSIFELISRFPYKKSGFSPMQELHRKIQAGCRTAAFRLN